MYSVHFDLLFWNISSAVLVPAQVFHPHRDKIRGQQRHQWQCKCTVLEKRSGPLPVLNHQSNGCFFFISTWFCIVLCELHLSTTDRGDHVVMTMILKPKALSQLRINHGAEPNRTLQARSVTSLRNNKCVVMLRNRLVGERIVPFPPLTTTFSCCSLSLPGSPASLSLSSSSLFPSHSSTCAATHNKTGRKRIRKWTSLYKKEAASTF